MNDDQKSGGSGATIVVLIVIVVFVVVLFFGLGGTHVFGLRRETSGGPAGTPIVEPHGTPAPAEVTLTPST